MKSCSKTSTLLARQRSADDELNARFAELFRLHRAAAFFGRQDQLFREHWTPEIAAAGYQFAGYEVRDGNIVLHGLQMAAGFEYRISIEFPEGLVDNTAAVQHHFERHNKNLMAVHQPNPKSSLSRISTSD